MNPDVPAGTPAGTRRFLAFSRSRGVCAAQYPMDPRAPNEGVTTLVYATDQTYFLVFQRRRPRERLLRRTVRRIIRDGDLLRAYHEGERHVAAEMQPGRMTPFVSEAFAEFSVYCDERTFASETPAVFPLSGEYGFAVPAILVPPLLRSLYGAERVHVVPLLD